MKDIQDVCELFLITSCDSIITSKKKKKNFKEKLQGWLTASAGALSLLNRLENVILFQINNIKKYPIYHAVEITVAKT